MAEGVNEDVNNIQLNLDNIATQVQGLTQKLSVNGVSQIVQPYDGSPDKFQEWVKSIQKYALLTNINERDKILVALQTSQSGVADYITRWLSNNGENQTWEDLKTQLTYRFSSVSDASHAFEILSKIKQKLNENIPIFGERILSLAQEAFSGHDLNLPIIQMQLVNFFINGLRHDGTKLRILREDPKTLANAVNSALTESQLQKRFDMRRSKYNQSEFIDRQDEPMDISHFRPSNIKCKFCKRIGHRIGNCRDYKRNPINEVAEVIHNPQFRITQNREQRANYGPYPTCPRSPNFRNNRNDVKGSFPFYCWACGKQNHFARDCRTNPKYRNTQRQSADLN